MNHPSPAVRALAFYLPQFHPIEENNQWWGPGFTEWTNVVRARPAFAGHHQPQVPADLGFYDLRCRDTRHEQARLARAHGLHGFCYYHYWFNGKLLLERPLLDLLDDQDLDFPFCVCWANENWTRRWDGFEKEVLIAQDYTAYDPDAHMAWLARAFRDPRYVRIGDRPLFIVYRASDLPEISGTIEAWRASARRHGAGDLYVCAVASSWNTRPPEELTAFGFDAVVEFEPNLRGAPCVRPPEEVAGLQMYQYRFIAERAMARRTGAATVFPGVFPSWDNTARRGWRATVVQNEDADLYQRWLEAACARVMHQAEPERLVFINAWNEWAEGCHLEPDRRHGRMFLEATARAFGVPVVSDAQARVVTTVAAPVESRALDVRLGVDRPIYIWGTGSAGLRVAAQLSDVDVRFAGFLDNDVGKWGAEVAGHPVYEPAPVLGALDGSATSPFILVASIAQDAIGRDIAKAGGRPVDHYLPDAADLILQRVYRPEPGFIRIGSSRRAMRCPVCLASQVDNAASIVTDVCARCQTSENARLAALVFCDTFDWASPPIGDCAPRPFIRVVHDAPSGDHLHALEASVAYQRVTSPAEAPRSDVNLIMVGVRHDTDLRAWMAYSSEHLALGGQLVFLVRPGRESGFDIRSEALPYGLSVGTADRDWPQYGVGRSTLWMCRRG